MIQSFKLRLRSILETVALALLLGMLWLLMHGYHGLTGDGQIYAFQAMARLHPHLSADLYLQNTSQDRFTLFSPIYAWCIGLLGLEGAARMLTLLFTLWFLAAVWSFARVIVGRDGAWGAVALLLIAAGNYGGSGVFHLLEPFLTARLPAQALIVTAFCCQVRGMPWLGLALALTALLIHPLMGLPGLLSIVCLWLPFRLGIIGAIFGVISAFALSVAGARSPTLAHILVIMDAPWLNVVRERSQFLFLQLWSLRDWELNAQPFLCLGLIAIAVPDQRIRKLCAATALVGAVGLAVALIGGLMGPVAILVQGQAWRWVWVTELVSVVLLPFTALQVARDEKCGLLCALLLLLGGSVPGIGGAASIALAIVLWLTRTHFSTHAARHLRWVCTALGITIGVWLLSKCSAILSPQAGRRAPLGVLQLQEIFALEIPAALLCALIGWGLRVARTTWVPMILSAMLAGFSALLIPAAFRQFRTLASTADIQQFADWAHFIPPTSTVLVIPSHDVGAFVWFTLDRPNYLSLDQSAGVVFSRATALEIRRRSDVLLPLMDPDWRLLTRLRSHSVGERKNLAAMRPLTARNLAEICLDPQLGFVVSPEQLVFGHLTHGHADAWRGWNLYDCRTVRSAMSAT